MGCQCTKEENLNTDQIYDIERYKYLGNLFLTI